MWQLWNLIPGKHFISGGITLELLPGVLMWDNPGIIPPTHAKFASFYCLEHK